jgi:hypothetical protein
MNNILKDTALFMHSFSSFTTHSKLAGVQCLLYNASPYLSVPCPSHQFPLSPLGYNTSPFSLSPARFCWYPQFFVTPPVFVTLVSSTCLKYPSYLNHLFNSVCKIVSINFTLLPFHCLYSSVANQCEVFPPVIFHINCQPLLV